MRSILWEVWHFRWRIVVARVGGRGGRARDVLGTVAALPVGGLAGGDGVVGEEEGEYEDYQVESGLRVITDSPTPGEDLTEDGDGSPPSSHTLLEDFTGLGHGEVVTGREARVSL